MTTELWFPEGFDWKKPDYREVWAERARRLAKMREPGYDIEALKEFYKNNPANFIHDWLVTSDPRNAEVGIEVVVPFLLFPKQREYIDWLLARWRGRDDGVTEKSRDMGASWLCCAFAVWMLIFWPGTVAGFGSRKEEYVDRIGDPKSLFWKIRAALELLPREFKPALDMPFMRIQNKDNGASIIGEAGDNIGRGNRTSIYFVDEGAFIEHAEAVDAALSQTSNCKQWVSTPNGIGNPFYRKRHSGRVPTFVFDWRDDPRKDRDWYLVQKGKLDPVVLAQEVDRDYSASVSNAFIPGRTVTEAMGRGPMDVVPMGPVMMGIDCARFGDDKTCITIRQGRVIFPQVTMGKVDVVDAAGRAADIIRRWPEPIEQIAVDTIGIGAGVADILRRTLIGGAPLGDRVVDVNSSIRLDDGENYNLRARMWRDMRDWIANKASLPNDAELAVDLTGLQYGYREGLLLIESKEAAKKRGIKSPDRADSIALTFAMPPKAQDAPSMPAPPEWRVLDEITGW